MKDASGQILNSTFKRLFVTAVPYGLVSIALLILSATQLLAIYSDEEARCMGLWGGVLREDLGHNRLENHAEMRANMEVIHAIRMAERESGEASNDESIRLSHVENRFFRSARGTVLSLDDPEMASLAREILDQALLQCSKLSMLKAGAS